MNAARKGRSRSLRPAVSIRGWSSGRNAVEKRALRLVFDLTAQGRDTMRIRQQSLHVRAGGVRILESQRERQAHRPRQRRVRVHIVDAVDWLAGEARTIEVVDITDASVEDVEDVDDGGEAIR